MLIINVNYRFKNIRFKIFVRDLLDSLLFSSFLETYYHQSGYIERDFVASVAYIVSRVPDSGYEDNVTIYE